MEASQQRILLNLWKANRNAGRPPETAQSRVSARFARNMVDDDFRFLRSFAKNIDQATMGDRRRLQDVDVWRDNIIKHRTRIKFPRDSTEEEVMEYKEDIQRKIGAAEGLSRLINFRNTLKEQAEQIILTLVCAKTILVSELPGKSLMESATIFNREFTKVSECFSEIQKFLLLKKLVRNFMAPTSGESEEDVYTNQLGLERSTLQISAERIAEGVVSKVNELTQVISQVRVELVQNFGTASTEVFHPADLLDPTENDGGLVHQGEQEIIDGQLDQRQPIPLEPDLEDTPVRVSVTHHSESSEDEAEDEGRGGGRQGGGSQASSHSRAMSRQSHRGENGSGVGRGGEQRDPEGEGGGGGGAEGRGEGSRDGDGGRGDEREAWGAAGGGDGGGDGGDDSGGEGSGAGERGRDRQRGGVPRPFVAPVIPGAGEFTDKQRVMLFISKDKLKNIRDDSKQIDQKAKLIEDYFVRNKTVENAISDQKDELNGVKKNLSQSLISERHDEELVTLFQEAKNALNLLRASQAALGVRLEHKSKLTRRPPTLDTSRHLLPQWAPWLLGVEASITPLQNPVLELQNIRSSITGESARFYLQRIEKCVNPVVALEILKSMIVPSHRFLEGDFIKKIMAFNRPARNWREELKALELCESYEGQLCKQGEQDVFWSPVNTQLVLPCVQLKTYENLMENNGVQDETFTGLEFSKWFHARVKLLRKLSMVYKPEENLSDHLGYVNKKKPADPMAAAAAASGAGDDQPSLGGSLHSPEQRDHPGGGSLVAAGAPSSAGASKVARQGVGGRGARNPLMHCNICIRKQPPVHKTHWTRTCASLRNAVGVAAKLALLSEVGVCGRCLEVRGEAHDCSDSNQSRWVCSTHRQHHSLCSCRNTQVEDQVRKRRQEGPRALMGAAESDWSAEDEFEYNQLLSFAGDDEIWVEGPDGGDDGHLPQAMVALVDPIGFSGSPLFLEQPNIVNGRQIHKPLLPVEDVAFFKHGKEKQKRVLAFLMDSGCSVSLISEGFEEFGVVIEMNQPVRIRGIGGNVWASKKLRFPSMGGARSEFLICGQIALAHFRQCGSHVDGNDDNYPEGQVRVVGLVGTDQPGLLPIVRDFSECSVTYLSRVNPGRQFTLQEHQDPLQPASLCHDSEAGAFAARVEPPLLKSVDDVVPEMSQKEMRNFLETIKDGSRLSSRDFEFRMMRALKEMMKGKVSKKVASDSFRAAADNISDEWNPMIQSREDNDDDEMDEEMPGLLETDYESSDDDEDENDEEEIYLDALNEISEQSNNPGSTMRSDLSVPDRDDSFSSRDSEGESDFSESGDSNSEWLGSAGDIITDQGTISYFCSSQTASASEGEVNFAAVNEPVITACSGCPEAGFGNVCSLCKNRMENHIERSRINAEQKTLQDDLVVVEDGSSKRFQTSVPRNSLVSALPVYEEGAYRACVRMDKKLTGWKVNQHARFDQVEEKMNNMLNTEVFEEVPEEELTKLEVGKHSFVPLNFVEAPGSCTTRVRFTCNYSYAEGGQLSNNDTLVVGDGGVTPGLEASLIKMRTQRTFLGSDIKKFYNQIRINIKSRNLHLVYIKVKKRNGKFVAAYGDNDEEAQIKVFRCTVLMFGMASSGTIAYAALSQVIAGLPFSGQVLAYVDDVTVLAESTEEAVQHYKTLERVIGEFGFVFNEEKTALSPNPEGMTQVFGVKLAADSQMKVLGYSLKFSSDSFHIREIGNIGNDEAGHLPGMELGRKHRGFRGQGAVSSMEQLKEFFATVKWTRRTAAVLAASAGYDPLGILAPDIVQLRVTFREVCRATSTWDSQAPAHLKDKMFGALAVMLSSLQDNISIPRWFGDPVKCRRELVVYCDASETAFSVVAVLRMFPQLHYDNPETNEATEVINLFVRCLVSLSKLATVPQNELCSVTKGFQCLAATNLALGRWWGEQIPSLHLVADSATALQSIRHRPCFMTTFFASRILLCQNVWKEISSQAMLSVWHCRSQDNMADTPSRVSKNGDTLRWHLRMKELPCAKPWAHLGNLRNLTRQQAVSAGIAGRKHGLYFSSDETSPAADHWGPISAVKEKQLNKEILAEFKSWDLSEKVENTHDPVGFAGEPEEEDSEIPPLQAWVTSLCMRYEHNVESVWAVLANCLRWSKKWRNSDADILLNHIKILTTGAFFAENMKLRGKLPVSVSQVEINSENKQLLLKSRRWMMAGVATRYTQRVISTETVLGKTILNSFHAKNCSDPVEDLRLQFLGEFWSDNLSRKFTAIKKNCPRCIKRRAEPQQVEMAPAPVQRFRADRPCGSLLVDISGPYWVHDLASAASSMAKFTAQNPPPQASRKAWVLGAADVFSRLKFFRAMESFSADSFLSALYRVMVQTGQPTTIHCDAGSQIQGAARKMDVGGEPQEEGNEDNLPDLLVPEPQRVAAVLKKKGINFRFAAPKEPWYVGGIESVWRLVNPMLKEAVNGNPKRLSILDFETILGAVQAKINARPCAFLRGGEPGQALAPIDVVSPSRFSPFHAELAESPPEISREFTGRAREQFQVINSVFMEFSTQFQRAYWKRILELPHFKTSDGEERRLKLGDIVAVLDLKNPKTAWPRLGVVTGLDDPVTQGDPSLRAQILVKDGRSGRTSRLVRPVRGLSLVIQAENATDSVDLERERGEALSSESPQLPGDDLDGGSVHEEERDVLVGDSATTASQVEGGSDPEEEADVAEQHSLEGGSDEPFDHVDQDPRVEPVTLVRGQGEWVVAGPTRTLRSRDTALRDRMHKKGHTKYSMAWAVEREKMIKEAENRQPDQNEEANEKGEDGISDPGPVARAGVSGTVRAGPVWGLSLMILLLLFGFSLGSQQSEMKSVRSSPDPSLETFLRDLWKKGGEPKNPDPDPVSQPQETTPPGAVFKLYLALALARVCETPQGQHFPAEWRCNKTHSLRMEKEPPVTVRALARATIASCEMLGRSLTERLVVLVKHFTERWEFAGGSSRHGDDMIRRTKEISHGFGVLFSGWGNEGLQADSGLVNFWAASKICSRVGGFFIDDYLTQHSDGASFDLPAAESHIMEAVKTLPAGEVWLSNPDYIMQNIKKYTSVETTPAPTSEKTKAQGADMCKTTTIGAGATVAAPVEVLCSKKVYLACLLPGYKGPEPGEVYKPTDSLLSRSERSVYITLVKLSHLLALATKLEGGPNALQEVPDGHTIKVLIQFSAQLVAPGLHRNVVPWSNDIGDVVGSLNMLLEELDETPQMKQESNPDESSSLFVAGVLVGDFESKTRNNLEAVSQSIMLLHMILSVLSMVVSVCVCCCGWKKN